MLAVWKAAADLVQYLLVAVFSSSAVIMSEKYLKLDISPGWIRYLTSTPEPMSYMRKFHVAGTH